MREGAMYEFAVHIRSDLDALSEEYERRLQAVSGYAEMPDLHRSEAARNAWLVVAASLEAEDENVFTQFIRTVTAERMGQGFQIESVRAALRILTELLEPRLPSVEAANFFWQMMVQANVALSAVAIDKLRMAEEQFRYLADNLAVGIFIHRDGILRYAGREGARLLGYEDPAELVGRSVFEFVHPNDRSRVIDIARRRVIGEPVQDQYEACLVRRDNSLIDAQIYSTLTEYEGQVATQGIFVDITERKREERRVKQSRETLRQLIDSMPFGIVITGRDRRIRHANQSALASMGYESEKEVLGLFCHETMCPAEADNCPILDLGQKLDRSERVLVTKDGDHVPILKSAVPLALGGQEVLLEAFVDIAEKKELEQQIEQSFERRGRQVQTSTEIAQEIASAPALNELYQKVVTLVKERFGYYHAQLFLLDEEESRLVAVAGYGEVGSQTVQQGHHIPMGRGVVGRAGASGHPVLSTDVSKDSEWLYHPLLPKTKGELAVPIVLRRAQDLRQASVARSKDGQTGELRGRVLGVLDVQSDNANTLNDDDRILLEGLCGQIALAIESTRLRQETEAYLRELERLTRVMSREGWEDFRRKSGSVGYLFDRSDVVPADDLLTLGIEEEAWGEASGLPFPDTHSVAVASLRAHGGEFIGMLGVQDDPENPLSQEDLQLIESVSEEVARSLEGARLFEETQRRLQELTMLFEVSQTLAGAPLEAEEIATIIAHQFVQAMRVPEASVSVLDPETQELRLLADVYADPAQRRVRHMDETEVFRVQDYPATAHVIKTLQPLVVHASDPNADPAELAYMKRHGTETLVVIPLVVKGQAVGIVELEAWDEEQRYSTDDLSLLMTLANQAAVALENARLLGESQSRASDQLILNEMARALTACQDVDGVLDEAYRGVARLMESLNFYGILYDPAARVATLAMMVVDGQVERPNATLPTTQMGFSEHLIASRQALLLPDRVPERAEEMGLTTSPLVPGRVPASWLGAPMMLGDRLLGIMVVVSYTTPRAYDVHRRDLLSAVANQTAIALENVRLLESTRSALDEVQSTHRSYLRQAWRDHLRHGGTMGRGGYLYDRLQVEGEERAVPVPDLWRPEMERAVAEGRVALERGEDGGQKRAGMAVPITLRGQTLGVIGVEAPADDREWTEEEIAVVQAVGEQLGQALESARLFADTQRSAERERLIGEITAKIRASTDIKAILETTASELSQVLGTSRALVRLTTEGLPSASTDEETKPAKPPVEGQVRPREDVGKGM